MREKTLPTTNGWYRLGYHLIKLDYLDKAEHLYRILFDQIPELQKKQSRYLSSTWMYQGIYEEALQLFWKNLSDNYGNWDYSYNNIASMYEDTGEYVAGELLAFEKSLKIRQQYSIKKKHHILM